MTEQNENNEPIDMATIEDNEIKEMKATDLAELCEDQGLQKKGNKKTLIGRLFLKKYGRSDKYVSLMTKCKICGAKVRVTSTKKEPMGDGRIMIVRGIKCYGRHCHTYTLKDPIAAD